MNRNGCNQKLIENGAEGQKGREDARVQSGNAAGILKDPERSWRILEDPGGSWRVARVCGVRRVLV